MKPLMMFVVVVALVGLSIGMKHHHHKEKMKDGGFSKIIHGAMMMVTDTMKNSVDQCPNPVPFFSYMFGQMCDMENCQEHAYKCMSAIMPPGGMCQHLRKCIPDEDEVPAEYTRQMKMDMKKKVADCMCQSMMEAMGVDYVPDEYMTNALAYMDAAFSNSVDITEAVKNDVMAAMKDGVCTPPTNHYMMSEGMKFKKCIVITCVKSLAGQ